jgi:hypothetical protein
MSREFNKHNGYYFNFELKFILIAILFSIVALISGCATGGWKVIDSHDQVYYTRRISGEAVGATGSGERKVKVLGCTQGNKDREPLLDTFLKFSKTSSAAKLWFAPDGTFATVVNLISPFSIKDLEEQEYLSQRQLWFDALGNHTTPKSPKKFNYQAREQLNLGSTTVLETVPLIGEPTGAKAIQYEDINFSQLEYAYLETDATGIVSVRHLFLEFKENILNGYYYTSSFSDDATDFDLEKSKEIEIGTSTKENVLNILGEPSGKASLNYSQKKLFQLTSF